MEYNRYFLDPMKTNRRQKDYENLTLLKGIHLPEDILYHIRICYKYDAIQKATKHHFEDEVLREIRCMRFRSPFMYQYYLEVQGEKQ